MRVAVGIAAAAALLWSSPALLAAPEASKVQAGRATGSAGPTGSASSGAALGTPDELLVQGSPSLGQRQGRWWGVSLALETHVALVQTEPDDSRSRPDKLYDYLVLSPVLFPSPRDQLRADLGAYQFFTADANEPGLRLADFVLTYTRFVPIATETARSPAVPPLRGVLLLLEAAATAPTSFGSHLAGVITVPRLRVYLERAFLGRNLIVTASGFGEQYVVRYRTASGGDANPLRRAAVELAVDAGLPFLRGVSVGAAADSSYTWYYAPGTPEPLPYGNVGDAQFPRQPAQQRYGLEAHAHYAFRSWRGLAPSVSLAYSVGDNQVLHDGVQHLYFPFYRRASEVYLTLRARY
jgi:hypothetical protein